MVIRTFVAIDSDNLVVTSSSSAPLVGNGVINNSSTPNGTEFLYTGGSGQTITLDDTGGNVDIFEDDNAANHTIVDGAGLVANGQITEAESLILLQALDAGGNPVGPVITLTVFSQGGVTGDVWGFSSDIPLVDGTSYLKTGGGNIGSSAYNSFVTCFTAGTAINTPAGTVAIENLTLGSHVTTRNNGAAAIRWIGQRTVAGTASFAPITFASGALGNDAEFSVSPEHRMLIEDPAVALLFGASSALVAAKHLVGLPGVTQQDVPQVTYYHLMFDTHQIICGAGCWSESFFLAENAVNGLESFAQAELRTLFPGLNASMATFGQTAEMTLKAHEAALLRAFLMPQDLTTAA